MVLPQQRVLPWWLVLLLFLPVEVWILLRLRDGWGLGKTVLALLLVGLVASRAARPGWLLRFFRPGTALRRNRARIAWAFALAVAAGALYLLPWGPQPWLPALVLVETGRAVLG